MDFTDYTFRADRWFQGVLGWRVSIVSLPSMINRIDNDSEREIGNRVPTEYHTSTNKFLEFFICVVFASLVFSGETRNSIESLTTYFPTCG